MIDLNNSSVREKLIDDLTVVIVEGMDWDTLTTFVRLTMAQRYATLNNEQLLEEVQEFAPWLIDKE